MTSLPAAPQDLDCFVIDNNGFILISERPQEVSCWGARMGRKGRRKNQGHERPFSPGEGERTLPVRELE